MDSQDKTSGLPKRPCPVLTKDNSEQWFRRMEIFLRGEDLFHTVLGNSNQPITTKSQYKTIWWISLCLGEDDEELVSDMTSAKAVWEELKRKYTDNKASGRKMLKQYFNYQMTDETIDAAWSHLLALGRRVKTAQPKLAAAFEPEARIQVLLSGLPDQWSSIRDAIDGQPSLSPDSILSILQEKEVDMPKLPAQHALTAKASFFKDKKHSKFPAKQEQRLCKLCNQDKHMIILCPYLEIAKGMVQVIASSNLVDPKKAIALNAYNGDESEEEVD